LLEKAVEQEFSIFASTIICRYVDINMMGKALGIRSSTQNPTSIGGETLPKSMKTE